MFSRKVYLPFLFIILYPLALSALTIDEFQGSQTAEAIAPFGTDTNAVASSGAIGGTRTLRADAVTGTGRLTAEVEFDRYSHSQDATVTGFSYLYWDADLDTTSLEPTGLGGIDFTQDGSTAITLEVLSFDNPSPVDITVTVYDGADATGSSYSTYVLTIDEQITTLTAYNLPFGDFVPSGAGADFTNVGAVHVAIDGTQSEIDLTLEWIGTDSECRLVPDENGRVVDECGVCGGDNSTCADCEGVPYGPNGPGTACENGELGVCDGGTYDDNCDCIRNEEPSDELCDGLDNDCDGDIDEAFPLLNQSCSFGEGVCAVDGMYVCTDDGGLMCDADLEQQQYEECEDSKGCDGVPNSGLTIDVCGVCGGDGTECADCKGVPNGPATLDRCDECEGDGQSCISCESRDLRQLQTDLDGQAKLQERVVNKVMRRYVKLSGKTAKSRKYAAKINNRANALEQDNWRLSWTPESDSLVCEQSPFCIESSNLEILDQYRLQADQLRKLAIKGLRKIKKLLGETTKADKKLSNKANRLYDQAMELADQMPTVQSACF